MLEKKPLIYMPRKKRKNVVSGETPDDQLGNRFYGNVSFFQTALTEMGTYGRDQNKKFVIVSKDMTPFCMRDYHTGSIVKLDGKVGYLLENGMRAHGAVGDALHMAIIKKDANETPSECISKCRWVDAPITTSGEYGLEINTYVDNSHPGAGIRRGISLIYYFPFSDQNLDAHQLYHFTKFDMYRWHLSYYIENPLTTVTYQIPDPDLETGVEWRIRKFYSGQVWIDANGYNTMQGTFILDTWFDSGHLDLTKDEGVFLILDDAFCRNTEMFDNPQLLNEMVLKLFNEEVLHTIYGGNIFGRVFPYKLKPNPLAPYPKYWLAESMNTINVLPFP